MCFFGYHKASKPVKKEIWRDYKGGECYLYTNNCARCKHLTSAGIYYADTNGVKYERMGK